MHTIKNSPFKENWGIFFGYPSVSRHYRLPIIVHRLFPLIHRFLSLTGLIPVSNPCSSLAPIVYGDSNEVAHEELGFVRAALATVPVAPFVWGNASDIPAEISLK